MLDRLIDRICQFSVRSLERRNITRENEKPYLLRYYIRRHDKARPWMPGLYVHCFVSSDENVLHNHPFKWSVSLILSRGYFEDRMTRQPDGQGPVHIRRRFFKPLRLNLIRANDFHRVDLKASGTWTLFLAGPTVQSWGFLNIKTGRYYPHEDYLFYRNQPGWST